MPRTARPFRFRPHLSVFLVLSTQVGLGAAGPAPALERMRATLTLSEKDAMLLSRTRDAAQSVQNAGFYFLLSKVASLPALSPEDYRQLDAPAVANLLRAPDRYRYQPIRLRVKVYRIRRLTVGDGMTAGPYWSDEKPVFLIHAGNANLSDPAREPLILYAAGAPPNPGPPSETYPDGDREYKHGPEYDVAGVFLQYIRIPESGDGNTPPPQREYPVVLVWQMVKCDPLGAADWPGRLFGAVVFLGILLAAAVFILLKKRIRQAKAHAPTWRGLRHDLPHRNTDTTGDIEEAVDPDLASAAEDYRRSHAPRNERSAPDGPDDTN